MNKEKIEYYAHLTVTLAGLLLIISLAVRYLFFAILPFLLAWTSAMLIRPLSNKISSRIRISARVIAPILAVLLVSAGLFLAIGIAVLLLGEAWEVLSSIIADDGISQMLSSAGDPIRALVGDEEGANVISEYIDSAVNGALARLSDFVVDILSRIVRGVPRVLIFILVTVVASVYFSIDINKINARVKRHLPSRWSSTVVRLKSRVSTVGKRYIRSYLILMSITFAVVLTGLLLLGVRRAPLIALIVAILDVLPLIGVGTVLLPWGVISILIGNVGRGIALLVLLVIHEIVRQIAEPRILGKSLGIHPLMSLVLLYVSYEVLGFGGILLVPLLVVLVGMLGDKNDPAEILEGSSAEADD